MGCTSPKADTFKVSVKHYNLGRMMGGRCVSVLNEATFEVEYVRLFNTNNVENWPVCMVDSALLIMAIVSGSIGVCMVCCLIVLLCRRPKKPTSPIKDKLAAEAAAVPDALGKGRYKQIRGK